MSFACYAWAVRPGVLERLSGDAPTNEDGTIDHVLVVTKSTSATTYETIRSEALPDARADVSDHLMITSVVRRARAPPPAARPAEGVRCGVDHLVYTCARLEDGVRAMERRTGVRAIAGGRHPGIGTHNALLSLGSDVYLEIIAPDPEQPEPAQPRPFFLDDPSTHNKIVAFAVHPVASPAHAASLEVLHKAMARAGEDAGEVRRMSRMKPDGSELAWRLTPLARAAGARPWLIDWGAAPSPATTSPAGCTLVGLTCYGPDAVVMGNVLLEAMGLQPLAASGEEVKFVAHRRVPGHIVAELETPKGRVRIGA